MYVHQLQATATVADLTSSNYIPVDGVGGSKKLPADKVLANPTTTTTDISAVDIVAKDKTTGEVVKVDGKTVAKTILVSVDNQYVNSLFGELYLEGILHDSVSGIRAFYARLSGDKYRTGIQITSSAGTFNFYKDFSTQSEAAEYAQSIFYSEVGAMKLCAFVNWDYIGVGGIFERSSANLSSICNKLEEMPRVYSFVLNKDEKERALVAEGRNFEGIESVYGFAQKYNFWSKEPLELVFGNLSNGIPTSSTNRIISKPIHVVKGSRFVIDNKLSAGGIGWFIHFFDTDGHYNSSDTSCWANNFLKVGEHYEIVFDFEGFVRFGLKYNYDNVWIQDKIDIVNQNSFVYTNNSIWNANKRFVIEKFSDVVTDEYYRNFADKMNALGSIKLFALQTDTHYSSFNGYPHALECVKQLNKVSKLVPLPLVANLGDLSNGFTAKPSNMSDIAKMANEYTKIGCPYIQLFGNHDDASWWATSHLDSKVHNVIDKMEWGGIVNPIQSRVGTNVMLYGTRYGVYDDVPLKVRYIYLDTSDIDYTLTNADGTMKYTGQYKAAIRQDQIDFLVNALFSRSDYKIVILSHYSLAEGSGHNVVNADIVRGLLTAFKNKTTYSGSSSVTDFEVSVNADFSGGSYWNGKLVGCFSGHGHADNLWKENGVNYVMTQCAHVHNDQTSERSTSDETMNAIDFVSINSAGNTCYLTRFGFGNDRSFTF